MASITTTIPTGLIKRWCLGSLESFDGERYECANKTLGTKESDFQTFCCNGEILNVEKSIWIPGGWGNDSSMNLSDMVCCGLGGHQAGGLHPLPTAYTECSEGSPTPLASLACTNTENAVPFLVTYTSASFGDNTVGDYVPTETPSCFWAYKVDVAMETITLPVPDITTLPPATTDVFGLPITTTRPSRSDSGITSSRSSASPGTTIFSGTVPERSSGISSVSTLTSSSIATAHAGIQKGLMCICLGLVALSLF
ncbi:hypothetical protein F5B20DRAFT_275841 [Whalleya microplaca]|nr:hypothetical protein F5B20DRAFT_275841 [Whalleya microplaca]